MLYILIASCDKFSHYPVYDLIASNIVNMIIKDGEKGVQVKFLLCGMPA